jgi:hypothetical protein
MTKFINKIQKQVKYPVIYCKNKGWFIVKYNKDRVLLGCNKVDVLRNMQFMHKQKLLLQKNQGA